tara:strand:- start:432 stop:1148 length:717 start_codon:yes stop_codon:yes gene_type:complete
MAKSKVVEVSVEEQEQTNEIQQGLVSLIDKNIVEIRKAENSTSTIELMEYISNSIYPMFKNKDKEKEIKTVRKYLLACYPFDDTLGISRNAYDTMNSRISRGGQLVFHKKLVIKDAKLQDKKGNRIIISKVEEMHNTFTNKKKDNPKIEIVQEDIETPPTIEESNYKPQERYVEFSSTDEKVEELINSFSSLMMMTEAEFENLLHDRNIEDYIKENYKPLNHRLNLLLTLGEKKSKVA